MRILFFTVLLACAIPALAMTDAERNLIATSAKKDPLGWGNQETVNTVRRLGGAGDLEALDFLISLNHWSLADLFVGGFQDARLGQDPAPFERRLLAQYDNPRMAITLMRGIDKYASPAVLDRLLGDATRLAKAYADEAKRCKIFVVTPVLPPYLSLDAKEVIQKVPKLDCAGPAPLDDQERFRMQAAVRMLGKTDRTDAARRIQPLLAALTATPSPRDEEAEVMALKWTASRVRDLHSIAELIGRQQYRNACEDLTAIVRKLPAPARTEAYLVAAWPLMLALGQLDRREGTEAIADWIDWRSATVGTTQTPTPAEMVRLLGPVLPEAQVDVAALRSRVMPRVPNAHRADYENAFSAAEKTNQGLRDPEEVTLIAWARQNNPRLVRYVLSRGITPNAHDSMGDTALTVIVGHAQSAYLEVFNILIDAGADPDGPDHDGMTPFHNAVEWFSPREIEPYKMVDFWYAKKADVNRATGWRTPLVTAAERSTEMVKYLLERGAKTEIAGRNGLTPLHAAARGAKAENIKQLLAAGARVDATDRDKLMPLHYAVRSRSVESAEHLLRAGADVNAEIEEGRTPLAMAQDNGDPAMEALLKQYGGRVNHAYEAKRAAKQKLLEMFYRGH